MMTHDTSETEKPAQTNRAERRRQAKLALTQPARIKKWRARVARNSEKRRAEQNRVLKQEARSKRKELLAKIKRAAIEGVGQSHIGHRTSRYEKKTANSRYGNEH